MIPSLTAAWRNGKAMLAGPVTVRSRRTYGAWRDVCAMGWTLAGAAFIAGIGFGMQREFVAAIAFVVAAAAFTVGTVGAELRADGARPDDDGPSSSLFPEGDGS